MRNFIISVFNIYGHVHTRDIFTWVSIKLRSEIKYHQKKSKKNLSGSCFVNMRKKSIRGVVVFLTWGKAGLYQGITCVNHSVIRNSCSTRLPVSKQCIASRPDPNKLYTKLYRFYIHKHHWFGCASFSIQLCLFIMLPRSGHRSWDYLSNSGNFNPGQYVMWEEQ